MNRSKPFMQLKKGFTLIEVGVVLAIAAFLVIFVLVEVIDPNNAKTKVGKAVFEAGQISLGATDWGTSRITKYLGVDMQTLSDGEFISSEFVDGVGRNPWGGDYIASTPSGDIATFILRLTNVPDGACRKVMQKSQQASCSSNELIFTFSGD